MKWLQSKKRFKDVAKYNEKSGEFEILDRNSPDFSGNIDGSYEILGGVFVALYTNDLKIYIGVGSHTFLMDDDLVISIEKDNTNRFLHFTKNDVVLSTVKYKIASIDMFAGDTTAFVDDEDFDYGLFLKNVSKDKNRQKVILGTD